VPTAKRKHPLKDPLINQGCSFVDCEAITFSVIPAHAGIQNGRMPYALRKLLDFQRSLT
jgi:hypothetical protein